MKTVHVVAGLGAQNGGPSYSVPRLAKSLAAQGCSTDIYTVSEVNDLPTEASARVFPQACRGLPLVSQLRLSPELANTLSERSESIDLIHNHGLWLMPNIDAGRIAKKARTPLIVSPRGMLAPQALRFSSRKKRLFWALFQERAVRGAAAWHATSATEVQDIRDFGLRVPVAVIPNGIDMPLQTANHNSDRAQRTVLFFSRVHPIKGLVNLIAAWSRVSAQNPLWKLLIAGPDENNHRAELETRIARSGVESVQFLGPVYGEKKNQLFASTDVFVLPTKSENFGLVVAEALGAGLPVIVTKGAPWAGVESENCGWWIDHGVEPLTAALMEATSLKSAARRDMGLRGRAWMARDFSWKTVSEKMLAVYEWAQFNAAAPDCLDL